MINLRVALITLLITCFLQTGGAAQENKPSELAQTGLVLEVTYSRGKRPAYQAVPNNTWYGDFRQLEKWKPAEDFLPVQAVNVAARMEGAAVRIVVSVHQGKKLFEKQDVVGSYLLRENERLTVYDMTAYGLEPFEVTVVRVEPRSAYAPAVTSNARSIEVRNVQAVESTFPMFKLTLRNTSPKAVVALFMEMFVDGRLRVSAMPHSREGEPLIAAGETYEYKRQLNNDARPAGGGFAPETAPNQTVLIKTAVFEDGTYEGDAALALRYRAFALGHQTQLAHLAALFNQALQSTGQDTAALLNSLREQVNALGTQVAAPAVDKLLGDFPGVAPGSLVGDAAEVTMFELKKEALKAIDEFRRKREKEETGDREVLEAWLIANRDRYQEWHDLVKKLNRKI